MGQRLYASRDSVVRDSVARKNQLADSNSTVAGSHYFSAYTIRKYQCWPSHCVTVNSCWAVFHWPLSCMSFYLRARDHTRCGRHVILPWYCIALCLAKLLLPGSSEDIPSYIAVWIHTTRTRGRSTQATDTGSLQHAQIVIHKCHSNGFLGAPQEGSPMCSASPVRPSLSIQHAAADLLQLPWRMMLSSSANVVEHLLGQLICCCHRTRTQLTVAQVRLLRP